MIFSQEEFNSRITKVKDSMNKKGIEILLTTDPSNMNYLTGYDGWSFYVPQGVIVSIDEEQPYWFGRKQDSNGARITTHLNEENIFGYPENLIQSPCCLAPPEAPFGSRLITSLRSQTLCSGAFSNETLYIAGY